MRTGLGVHLREVGVHVEHPGVRVPEEAEARRAEAANRRGGGDPVGERVPGGVAVEQRAGHGRVRDARPRERSRELGHAAGRAVGEPLAGGHGLVVEGAHRLQVEDDDRHLRRLHRREHLRRGGVGRRVEHDQLDPARGEPLPGLARGLRGIDEAGRDDLGPEVGELRLEPEPVALEPLAQPLELRPVRGEADPEDADPAASRALRQRVLRRAGAPRGSAAATARAGRGRRRSARSRSGSAGRRRRCSGPARRRARGSSQSGGRRGSRPRARRR